MIQTAPTSPTQNNTLSQRRTHSERATRSVQSDQFQSGRYESGLPAGHRFIDNRLSSLTPSDTGPNTTSSLNSAHTYSSLRTPQNVTHSPVKLYQLKELIQDIGRLTKQTIPQSDPSQQKLTAHEQKICHALLKKIEEANEEEPNIEISARRVKLLSRHLQTLPNKELAQFQALQNHTLNKEIIEPILQERLGIR